MNRCQWCLNDDIYKKYHDTEWGVPIHDDQKHFEFLVLESAQAGLSWLTILKRRNNYKLAYDNFDPLKVANYNEEKINELMHNDGIIKNRRKIESSINNAKMFLKIVDLFGSFDSYIWRFVDGNPIINKWHNLNEVPAKTSLSDKISKDMKIRGFKFIGSTIIYSHMQAVGIVNDHVMSCFRYNEIINGIY